MYSLDGVALSGSLLASLLNEAASPYAGSEPRKGTRYTDGLLFGSVNRRQGTETEDDHERRATTHREAEQRCQVTFVHRHGVAFTMSSGRSTRGDWLGSFLKGSDWRATLSYARGFYPPVTPRNRGATISMIWWFCSQTLDDVARTALSYRGEVFRGMVASSSASGQLPVLFVACLRLRDGAPTQSFQYQCLTAQGGGWRATGCRPVLPCRINNLTMDSSAEYGHVRPSPVVPLGVEGAQQSALEEAFGPVPPPYVSEAEALLDTGIKTMENLVSELKLVENTVVRLQLENRCMERVLMNRGGS